MAAWWTELPPPRVLYTDVSGGVVEGYSEADVREIVRKLVREIVAAPEPPMRMTETQARALRLLLEHGSPTAAAKALGLNSAQSIDDALRRLKVRYPGRNTLQLCVEFSRRGYEIG